MTPSDAHGGSGVDDAVRAAPLQAAPTSVSDVMSRLDGVETLPLTTQVEFLDAARRGLDEALAAPATHG